MKTVIIEDEKLAREKLESLIKRYDPQCEVIAFLDSVETTIQWLRNNPDPDLLFVDIHLADGISFEIFEQVNIHAPVIFTTAYDQYAIRAFRVNSVDYLLKPIQFEDLKRSLDKLKTWGGEQHQLGIEQLKKALSFQRNDYKSRFITKIGENIQSIDVKEIAFIFTEYKGVFIVTWEGKKHLVNYTLEQLESSLDPALFFRANRKYIVQVNAINKAINYSSGRLKLLIDGCEDSEIMVSREKVAEFKRWLDQ